MLIIGMRKKILKTIQSGTTKPGEISLELDKSKQYITNCMKELRDNGLINYKPGDDDAREHFYFVTQKGERAFKKGHI